MADIKRLEEALYAADKAGDTTSATIFANEIRKIQATEEPSGSIFTGITKRVKQAAEGVSGVGLRAGEALGIVSPESLKTYEQRIQEEKSVMSPTYGQTTPRGGAEIAGATLADMAASITGGLGLKAARNLPIVGGAAESVGGALLPTTVPQAAAGGALYSSTVPSETTGEAAIKAGLGAAGGGLTQFGLRQVGLAPQLPPNLTPQQQEVARRALAEGFQLDPTQITGYGGKFAEGLKSRMPIAGEAFGRFEGMNQDKVNTIAKQFIKLSPDVPLTNEAMESAFKGALNNYQVLKNVTSLQGNPKFVQDVNSALAKFDGIPKSQLSSVDKKTIRILNEYKNFGTQSISGNAAFVRSKKIGEDLYKAQKEGEGTSAEALKGLRRAFEDSIETYLSSPSNMMRKTGKETLDQFKSGRQTLSNWYLVYKAFNPNTGNVSASKLSKELAKKPTYGTTGAPIETAAMLSGAFPKAFPSSGTTERASYGNLMEVPLQSPFALGTYAATSGPVRNVLAQKYLGAKPEGFIGNIYGGVSKVGGLIPATARETFGLGLRNIEAQQQNQLLNPMSGLLGQ